MKHRYLIHKLLKRLADFTHKTEDPLQHVQISHTAREKAGQFYQHHNAVKSVVLNAKNREQRLNEFVQYQKEIQAIKLLKSSVIPQSPGKILKLPVPLREEEVLSDTPADLQAE